MIEVKINKLYGPEDQDFLKKDNDSAMKQCKTDISHLSQLVGWVGDSITNIYKLKAELKPTRLIVYFKNKDRPYSQYLNIVYYKYMYLESIQFDNENVDTNELINNMFKNIKNSLE